jgi:hypothetical protein
MAKQEDLDSSFGETESIVVPALRTALAILLILSLAYIMSYFFLKEDNPRMDVVVVYFAVFLSYLSLGNLFSSQTDELNVFKFVGRVFLSLLILNIILIIVMIVGFILHFILIFPFTLDIIFGWPSIVSVCVLCCATAFGFVLLRDNEKEYYDSLAY